MKFEVLDKREEREGMLIKKPVYCASARVEMTDEEFEALASMVATKEWKMYPVGSFPINDKRSIEMRLEMFYEWCKKKQGVLEWPVRTKTPEHRNLIIEEIKEVAITVKNVIAARLDALQTSDEDESVEL